MKKRNVVEILRRVKKKIGDIATTALALVLGIVAAVLVQALFSGSSFGAPGGGQNGSQADDAARGGMPVYYNDPADARKLAQEAQACGADAHCFVARMKTHARAAHESYARALPEMHPVVRAAVAASCSKHWDELVHLTLSDACLGAESHSEVSCQTLCYRNALSVMEGDAAKLIEARIQSPDDNVPADLEKQLVDQGHFLGKVLWQTCGDSPSDECFDHDLFALRSQLVAAYNGFADSYDEMARWEVLSHFCSQAVKPGACKEIQAWPAALFVVAHPEKVAYAPRMPLEVREAPKPKPQPKPQPLPSPLPSPSVAPSATPTAAPSDAPDPCDVDALMKDTDEAMESDSDFVRLRVQALNYACDVGRNFRDDSSSMLLAEAYIDLVNLAKKGLPERKDAIAYLDKLVDDMTTLAADPKASGRLHLEKLAGDLRRVRKDSEAGVYSFGILGLLGAFSQRQGLIGFDVCVLARDIEAAKPGATRNLPTELMDCRRFGLRSSPAGLQGAAR